MIYEKSDKLNNKRKVDEAFENYLDDVFLNNLSGSSVKLPKKDENNLIKENDNISLLLELFYEELKKTPQKIYESEEHFKEFTEFYMDNDFYSNFLNNIEKGDYIQIYNQSEKIWCEVIRTPKNFYKEIDENNINNINNKKLLVRIDNVISNKEYSFNTIIFIKLTHVLDYCKKNELIYKFLRY